MYYGDDILILENGLRIRPKALRPIGITDGSKCWGVEIMPAPNQGKPPHLLVSAFHPDRWHILFRVVVELKDNPGALAKAAAILVDAGFNILSTQCAPSGHNHATWHIIVEAESEKIKIDEALVNSIKQFKPTFSAFDPPNKKFKSDLTKNFTVPLFRHSKDIEEKLKLANQELDKEEKFLHSRFLDQNTLLYTNEFEQFFDISNPKEKELLTRISQHELYRAVESRWLQQMAVFRCYSQAGQKAEGNNVSTANWKTPISFKYEAKTSLLKSEDQDHERYLQVIGTCAQVRDLPIKAIAAYNSEEHYLRIVLPEEKTRERRISIELNYTANLAGSHKSSKGLLKDVADILVNRNMNMNYVSNATTILTEFQEQGVISLVGTIQGNEEKKKVVERLKTNLASIDEKHSNLSLETTVGEVSAKVVFISTKFEFFKERKSFKDKIESVCKEHGLVPVWGDPQFNSDHSEAKLKALSEYIINRIQDSHAFLQVIPKSPMKQSWLIFELGIACGFNLPAAICVDGTRVRQYPPDVAEGWSKYLFNSQMETDDIIDEIRPAIENLAGLVYNQ